MGGAMARLFASHGLLITIIDQTTENVQTVLRNAKNESLTSKVKAADSYEGLCKSLQSATAPKVFIFSLPHGGPGDSVIEDLSPYLEKGDIIIDGANENFVVTERRQGELLTRGVSYLGTGVSGGYQSARHGPSISVGGEEHAMDRVLPLLKKVAARDSQGRECVGEMGSGGAGHYVKTVHNGIEQGMLCAICEVWGIMDDGLGMKYDAIGKTFEQWNFKDELVHPFCPSLLTQEK